MKDELEELEQQIQEIEEETTKPISPEQVTQEAADHERKVRKLEEKMELIERDLNGVMQQVDRGKLEKSKSIREYYHTHAVYAIKGENLRNCC